MVRRTKDDAEKTRDAILDAAEEVFYAHGVARTSLETIAKKAGVTRGAVYWHFKDKIEVFQAIMLRVFLPQEDIIERLALGTSKTPLDDLRQACCDALTLIGTDARRQRVISILTHRCEYVEEMASVMERKQECKSLMLERCQSLFERAKRLKQLSPGWTPRIAALSLQALMNGLIVLGLEQSKDYSYAKVGVSCVKAFFSSLRCPTKR